MPFALSLMIIYSVSILAVNLLKALQHSAGSTPYSPLLVVCLLAEMYILFHPVTCHDASRLAGRMGLELVL